ncbi:MAG: oligosaccharide flippase family protein [Elusimicrobiota bacterium]|jgi:O-antigen/teichoic acid export membrane protein
MEGEPVKIPPPSEAEPFHRLGRVQSSRWILAATVITRPIQLFMNVVLARLLEPVGFGLLGLANSTAVSFTGIAGFGLDAAVNRFSAEYYWRDTPTGRYFISLIMGIFFLISTTFFLTLAWLIPHWGVRFFPSTTPLIIIGLCLLLGWLNGLLTNGFNLLTGLQLFDAAASFSILQSVLMFGATLFLGWRWGPTGAIAGYLVAAIGCILFITWKLWRFDRKMFQLDVSLDIRYLKEIFGCAFPAWLGYLTFNPITTLTLAMLDHYPGGAFQLGMFQTANGLRMVLAVLPGVVGAIIAPAIFEEGGRLGRPDAYEKLLRNSLVAFSFLTLPLLTFLLFWRSWIFLIYGTHYLGSCELFVPLVAGVCVSLVSSPAQFALVAKNRMWHLQGIGVLKAVTLFVGAYLLLPRFLAYGLGWTFLASELVFAVCLYEFGIYWGVLPSSIRAPFYKFLAMIMVILLAGLWLPRPVAHALSLPVSMGLAALLVRRYPKVANWIVQMAPLAFRPKVEKMLHAVFVTPIA